MNISNRFLVFLLVVAILVTIVGTWYSVDRIGKFASLTGYQVTEGNVSVNITSKAEINVTQPNCAFGSGYVTAPAAYAILHPGPYIPIPNPPVCGSTNHTQDNWTNTTTYDPNCMEIRNDGNRNVSVNVSSGKNASEFIGGTNPEYKVWSQDTLEEDSCESGEISFEGAEMTKANITICDKFYPNNSTDELYVGCFLKIPDDTAGYKTDTWTFTGTAV